MTRSVPPFNRSVLALNIGQTATVSLLLNSPISLKLLEMGCIPGKEVCLLSMMSLGGPLRIKVGDQCFALRRDEAEHIIIEDKL